MSIASTVWQILHSVWQTVATTNQPTIQPKQIPVRLEDRKAQKLMLEIESKLAQQSKTMGESESKD
jgi:hypothetical protein